MSELENPIPLSEESGPEFQVPEETILRGKSALLPFVEAWDLPLNGQELDFMVYAILKHTQGADVESDLSLIQDDVRTMIAEDKERYHQMHEIFGEG